MKLWVKTVGLALSIPLVSGMKASGQEQDLGYANEGPLRLSARVGGEFTDNRDGLKDKKGNLDLFVEPRADYRFRDGDRTVLDFAVLPMVKWHSDPRTLEEGSAQNDTELFGTAAVELMHQLNRRVQLNLSDAITYNDDPEVSNGGANVRRSDNHIWNSLHAGVEAGVTEKVFAGAEGNYILKRYSDSAVANDEDEDILNGQGYMKYKTGAGCNLLGLVSASDFKNDSTTRQRGAQVYGAGAGLEKIFNPDMTGKVTVGYQHGVYDDDSLSDIDTPNGEVELTLRSASATRFRIGGSYGLYAPYVRPYSVQKLAAVTASVDHDLLPNRMVATLRGQVGRGDYKSEGADFPGGNDDLITVGASLDYRFSRVWSCNVGYTYENWDSDVRESFDRNMVDFSVKAEL